MGGTLAIQSATMVAQMGGWPRLNSEKRLKIAYDLC